MSVIMVTVLGWFLSPIITLLLPKILVFLGFDASDKLLELEIQIIPELKKTMQTVDQERMMQRGKRVKTDLDALDKMAAMLRHALEDAEDIFDDAQHTIVLGCWHRLFRAFAACRSSSCVWIARVVHKTSVWIMQWVPKIMSWSRHKIVLRCCHRVYGAFSACIALCKCCCVSIACVVRTKSARLLRWVRDISLSLFLLCRSEESVAVNVSAAVVSDKPVQVIIDIQASGGEPDPMTTNAEASSNETVSVTAGAAASDEPEPLTSSFEASADQPEPVTTSVEASDDEPEPMTTSVEAYDNEPDPVTTTSNTLSGRWLSCLCSSLDFFKSCCTSLYGRLGHLFESACFYRNWSYQVLGIKICQENASLFDILDIFLTAISRGKVKKRIQKVNKIVCKVNRSQLLGVASNSAPNDIANKNRSRIRATSKREVFGREVLRDDIMARLRETPQGEATRSSPCYSVIGIYGVAGSGKTTFAGYIRDYINEECKEDKLFDTIMCIHVSETFSVDEIFHEMLKDITKDRHSNISGREELEEKLKKALRSKRFFLILDDLWVKNKHDSQLEELISPLIVGAKGSKILVTARTKKAAGALCGDELIEMPGLDEDQYLKMFMHYALSGKSIAVKEFEQVGREIAKKLHRSPIAAVTVAGRLVANPNISFWKNVAKLDLLNDTMDALWWSYQQLNPDIRRCFEFCNIFPRRFKLEKDDLVHLWIAQGFVKTCSATEEMEDVAEGYIQELSSLQTVSSFTVKNEEGYEIKQLRDLNKLRGELQINDLENVKSKEEALEANLAAKKRLTKLTLCFSNPHTERRTAQVQAEVLEGLCPPVGLEELSIWEYNGSRYPDWMVGRLNGGPKDLQSLYFWDSPQLGPGPEFEAFPHLRMLTLAGCSWDALPGNMEHLTSLETLMITRCENIRSLPTLPQSLKEFELFHCDDELMKGCQTEGDPNWLRIKHIPEKYFSPCFPMSEEL
ncbi:hypothetical protein ZWY2020_029085 [Hordeum vulgare]|nr:hypothetical protein ZWY2020_029085 [Hordeum vulgare]